MFKLFGTVLDPQHFASSTNRWTLQWFSRLLGATNRGRRACFFFFFVDFSSSFKAVFPPQTGPQMDKAGLDSIHLLLDPGLFVRIPP